MLMKTYRVYTGPTLVKGVAARLRAAGLTVSLEGTAHVYVQALDQQRVLNALNSWHPRDVLEMPE